MRKKIVAGNWKMNNDLAATQDLLAELKKQVFPEDVAVMVAPAFTNLYPAYQTLREHPVEVISQNMHQSDKGAFTGEISASMLKSVGVNTVIIGHSERRSDFHETDALLAEKVDTALKKEMTVIFCVGEQLSDREHSEHFEVIKIQLDRGLFHTSKESWEQIVIAYEPVWAIGTGETATPKQAQEMHAFIRETIAQQYGDGIANNISILYGGSVKPNNAADIFSKKDVDGGLIGGASLKADDFMAIVNAFGK
ncbi:MAG: triose-phosphate isomerase [Flavobacteriaceae bacterium]|nr:triose-phosphate isomerase [Flavobacteriaceae bacterium]|tara:strand:- start:1839 stop:2594 length:756 start_codon:yes stop_codon:yes gene_type:complete